jgi:uncharacterized coiled-coil protein SlyX
MSELIKELESLIYQKEITLSELRSQLSTIANKLEIEKKEKGDLDKRLIEAYKIIYCKEK